MTSLLFASKVYFVTNWQFQQIRSLFSKNSQVHVRKWDCKFHPRYWTIVDCWRFSLASLRILPSLYTKENSQYKQIHKYVQIYCPEKWSSVLCNPIPRLIIVSCKESLTRLHIYIYTLWCKLNLAEWCNMCLLRYD